MQFPQTKDTKVIIDNNIVEWDRWEVIHNTDHTKRIFLGEEADPINVRIKLRLKNGAIVEFTPDAYESTKDTVYIYGLLRAFFPELARQQYLEPWQEAYHKRVSVPYRSIDRFRISKDNMIFKTHDALLFKAGWDAKLC